MGVHLEIVETEWQARSGDPCLFDFEQVQVLIGRGASVDVRLPHASVSNRHASILATRDRHVLQDESSTNGTWLNDLRLPPGVGRTLHDGDIIEVGSMRLRFRSGPCTNSITGTERTASIARRLVRELRGNQRDPVDTPRISLMRPDAEPLRFSLAVAPCRLTAGRASECQVLLSDPHVSQQHLEFVRDLDGVTVRDLGSKNGFEVNGRPSREHRLQHRDRLTIGSTTTLAFEDPAEEALNRISRIGDARVERPTTATRTATYTQQDDDEPAMPPEPRMPPTLASGRPLTERIVMVLAGLILLGSIVGLAVMLSA